MPFRPGTWLRVGAGRAEKALLQVVLGLSLGGDQAWSAEPPKALGFGVQAGLAVPAGDDLRITTGSSLSPAIGIHAIWNLNEFHGLRSRLDLWSLSRGHQEVSTPQIQRMDTKVQGLALGGEYLFRPGGHRGRWAAGAGLYLIRWSVESTNELATPTGGTARATGTSHWTREGLGLVASCRLTPRLDVEARWISSHYGYENLPANLGTVGLLWRF